MANNNQNNEISNTVTLAALIAFLAFISLGIIVIAFAMFLTLIAVCVQFKPITIDGETVTAKDGRRFILLGLLGTIPVALFLIQVANWLDLVIADDWAWALFLLSYSISALGIEWVTYSFWGKTQVPEQPEAVETPLLPENLPPDQPKTYRFADWDDDDTDPYK